MTVSKRHGPIQGLEPRLRLEKGGVAAIAGELRAQLDDRDFVKVKFRRATRGGTDTETLAADLAEQADAGVVETRGHTAVVE